MQEDNNTDNTNADQKVDPQRAAREAADVLTDAGVFSGLLDFGFSKLITLRIVKVVYILELALIAIAWIGGVVGGFAAGVGSGFFALIFGTLAALVGAILVRIGLELIVVIFRIGENTSLIAASKQ